MQGQSRRSLRDRLTTRLAHIGFLLTRPMTLRVRAAVIDGDDRVLLVKHGYVAGWHLPGGVVEVGETVENALTREPFEEANVVLEAPPALHGLFLNAHVSRRDHVAVYVARRFRVTAERAPNREIVAARFFDRDALPPDAARGTRPRLDEILGGAPISALW
jgi:ADP-ribose pyrophosphatase YjhB (NUDIX family)